MTTGMAEEEPALSVELSAQILSSHHELLDRFAREKPNALRAEIRRYRSMLEAVGTWADAQPGLWQLAHRAHWWEWYWFEREFGDSQFEPFRSAPDEAEAQLAFNRRHIALVAVTVPIPDLRRDLVEVARGGTAQLVSLSMFAATPGLQNLRMLIEQATPQVALRLRGAVAEALDAIDAAAIAPAFIDFLDRLPGYVVEPRGGDIWLLLADTVDAIMVASGAAADAWIRQESIRAEVETNVATESETDMAELLEFVALRAAA